MSLEVQGLHFTYEDAPLLAGIDLQVPDGQAVFLLGPSGCGKTSLLRCIAGLERPDKGIVHLGGQDMTDVPVHRRRIGMMFQEPALFPHLDVIHNVAFGIRYRPSPPKDGVAEARRLLDSVGLADKMDARVDELSGGQRQRVALARTMAARPRAVLLDEPLSALDRPLRERLGDQIKVVLAEEGVPSLWVTHDDQEVDRLADQAYEFKGGRLRAKP